MIGFNPESIADSVDRYRRLYNDTATWVAETLDGAMFTPFEYISDGHDLYAEDGSKMSDIFLDSLHDAKRIIAERPELAFEYRRRLLELEEYGDMVKMARGELPNTTVVVSDFPPELMNAAQSVGGYNVNRKQTMLRVLIWDGNRLKMYTQSLDCSDRKGLEAIYSQFGLAPQQGELLGQRIHLHTNKEDQPYITARLTGVYDRELVNQYGGEWYAGRQEPKRDTYTFTLQQHDILDHFAKKHLDRKPSTDDLYNVAALIRKRFKRGTGPISASEAQVALGGFVQSQLEWQLRAAGAEARAEGRSFDGCGMSAGARVNGGPDDLNEAGYGNKSLDDTDKLGSRWFSCPKGHMNYRRVANIKEKSCRQCGVDISCEPPKPKPKRPTYIHSPKEKLIKEKTRRHVGGEALRSPVMAGV